MVRLHRPVHGGRCYHLTVVSHSWRNISSSDVSHAGSTLLAAPGLCDVTSSLTLQQQWCTKLYKLFFLIDLAMSNKNWYLKKCLGVAFISHLEPAAGNPQWEHIEATLSTVSDPALMMAALCDSVCLAWCSFLGDKISIWNENNALQGAKEDALDENVTGRWFSALATLSQHVFCLPFNHSKGFPSPACPQGQAPARAAIATAAGGTGRLLPGWR